MSTTTNYEDQVSSQVHTLRATVDFINIVNDLWYDKSIELVLFRNQLIDKHASEVLNLINYAKEFVAKPITIFDALDIARANSRIRVASIKIRYWKVSLRMPIK